MSVRWDLYRQRFALGTTNQNPLPEALSYQIERWVGEVVLQLSAEDISEDWGDPSLPGVFALTVIHFLLPVERIGNPLIRALAQKWMVRQVGIKVYRTGAPSLVKFHKDRAANGEALQSSAFIQKSLWSAQSADWHGKPRGLVVQQWVEGCPLDQFICSHKFDAPLPGDVTRRLLESLFCGPVAEVWHASSPDKGVVWDWRPANLVVSEDQSFLSLIDSDCLHSMSSSPNDNERKAFGYLRTTTFKLLTAQRLSKNEDSIKEGVRSQWAASGIEGAISRLGESETLEDAGRQRAIVRRHVHDFLDALHYDGLLL